MTMGPSGPLTDEEWALDGGEALEALRGSLVALGDRIAPLLGAYEQMETSLRPVHEVAGALHGGSAL
jgi:hypothetical protein